MSSAFHLQATATRLSNEFPTRIQRKYRQLMYWWRPAGHGHRAAFMRHIKTNESKMENGLNLVALVVSATAFATPGAANAHHSLAMFDQEHRIEIAGTVVEFRYTSPHSFILIEVKNPDGDSTVWNLEGPSPSLLSRDGISATTIKPGDLLVVTIEPLRTGAPGGSWSPIKTWWFKDGRPLIGPKDVHYPNGDGIQNQ